MILIVVGLVAVAIAAVAVVALEHRGAINLDDLTTDEATETREWHDTPLFAETVAAMGHDTPAAQFARRVEEAT